MSGTWERWHPAGELTVTVGADFANAVGQEEEPESAEMPALPGITDWQITELELLDVVNGRLSIVAFEQGRVETPRPAMTQRLCAVKAEV